jgi:hypothetical protein
MNAYPACLLHWAARLLGPVALALVTSAAAPTDPVVARDFWSLRPPHDSPPPKVRQADWPRTDVDRHLLAGMETHGLAPAADADPATRLRRLAFDLTGLPPEPAAVERFTRDPSDTAWSAEVDRLLASPRFGERWGRHWLDVARYAESTGKERNFGFPEAWRYRDWVIAALNADQPYDAFVREQLAGDLLPAPDAATRNRQLTATGFLALGPKGLNERRQEQFLMDVVDEQIDVTSRAVLGMNLACARCHDHKSDPVTQRDYYALAGIFRSTQTLYGTAADRANRHPSDYLPLVTEWTTNQPPTAPAPVVKETDAEGKARRSAAKRMKPGQPAAPAKAAKTAEPPPQVQGPRVMGVTEGRPTQCAVLVRGEISQRGEVVPRGLVAVLTPPGTPALPRQSSGRLELAQWLTDRQNPLTARVEVNRVWLHLFGRGLVATPDNFGRTGTAPSHPELLDHLAVEFMADGWSVKRLVRRLVLSRAYGLASRASSAAEQADPENVWLSHGTLRRLDAEAIRDAMLAASGLLNEEPPQGSVMTDLGDGPLRRLTPDRLDSRLRTRSVYLPIVRGAVLDPLEVFDFPEPSLPVAEREATNVPEQSLFLMNNPVVEASARGLTQKAMALPEPARGDRLRLIWLSTLGREPTPAELRRAAEFLRQEGPAPRALVSLAQSLFACAEFRYLR